MKLGRVTILNEHTCNRLEAFKQEFLLEAAHDYPLPATAAKSGKLPQEMKYMGFREHKEDTGHTVDESITADLYFTGIDEVLEEKIKADEERKRRSTTGSAIRTLTNRESIYNTGEDGEPFALINNIASKYAKKISRERRELSKV